MANEESLGQHFRIRHTILRVKNLDHTLEFYQHFFEMNVIRRREDPLRGETVAYIGYGDEKTAKHSIEIVQESGTPKTLLKRIRPGQIALAVSDVEAVSKALLAAGVTFIVPPQPLHEGLPNKVAVLADPDGHEIEMVER